MHLFDKQFSYSLDPTMHSKFCFMNFLKISGTESIEKELELSGDISSNSKINWQKEICICI